MTNVKAVRNTLMNISKEFANLAELLEIEEDGKQPVAEVTPIKTKKEEQVLGLEPQYEVVEKPVNEEAVEVTTRFTRDQLDAMKYTEIQALAKECGVQAKGSKQAIIEKLLELEIDLEVEGDEPVASEPVVDDVEEFAEDGELVESTLDAEDYKEFLEQLEDDDVKTIAKELKVKLGIKFNKANTIAKCLDDLVALHEVLVQLELIEEEEATEDVDVEEEETSLAEQVEAEVADMSVQELADVLESVGMNPKGKRQTLVARIVEAVEQGLLSFDEEEGEESEEPAQDQEEEEADEYLVCKDEVREKALDEVEEMIEEQIESGELTEAKIDEVLSGFFEDYDPSLSLEDKKMYYTYLSQRLVDDEGEINDFESPYYINDRVVCCATFLEEENGSYVCPMCGTEYEAE